MRLNCPRCRSEEIRRSARRGLKESLLKRIRIVPYRCIRCETRFLRFRPLISEPRRV